MSEHHHRALRFLTAGSVDDGKSTLIGRLLFDSQAILADQLDGLERRAAGQPIDLALLTDGLEAEREQGITIDVAYRYFATRHRKFIIADAPGHEQYTRNMVTAAAGSDAAVVLVDIGKLDTTAGAVQLLPQTRRHALLARLLRVPSIVFAINKIDAVADPAQAFHAVRGALLQFARAAKIDIAAVVPISALNGDNVTRPLDVSWYRSADGSGPGQSLLQVLESLPAAQEPTTGDFSLPVQYVSRESADLLAADAPALSSGAPKTDQRRTFWGRIASGRVEAGQDVQVFPGEHRAVVSEVRLAGESVPGASAGQSAGIVLDRQLDVSRGDWLGTPGALHGTSRFDATLAWLDTEPAVVGRKYQVRHGNRWVQARIASITSRLDVQSLVAEAASQLEVNEIGRVTIETQQPLPVDAFSRNRVGGALIVVDPTTNRTSGALLAEPDGAFAVAA